MPPDGKKEPPKNLTEMMRMSLTLYFLRHGETTASRTGGYCGTLDPELTQGRAIRWRRILPMRIDRFHGRLSFPVRCAVPSPRPNRFARRPAYPCNSRRG